MTDDTRARRRPRPDRSTTRKINQSDIARRADVSISTVSRALSGAAGTRPEVRARILEIATSLGYSPAEALTADRAVVFLPMHPVTGGLHQVFHECYEGVTEAAAQDGITLFPYLLPESEMTGARIAALLDEHDTRAAMQFYTEPSDEVRAHFAERGTLVLVYNSDPQMRFDSIMPDGYAAARMMTESVIAAGHRRIAFAIGNTRLVPRQRLAGFRAAVADHPGIEGSVISIGYDREETAHAFFRETFQRNGKPDWSAAVCANDLIALGVLQAAWETGLSVPADFSLTGFDNIGWSQLATPRLRTMGIDRRSMGREAVRLLRRRMAQPEASVLGVLQGARFLAGSSVADVD